MRLTAVGLVVLALAALAGVWWNRTLNRRPASLIARIPVRDAVLVYVDFAALRQSGMLRKLVGGKNVEEPEYKAFVTRTHFNYKDDLDTAVVAFSTNARYFLARGRFDWKALRGYAEGERGYCDGKYCNMPGSTPERQISFFAVQSDILGLAVTPHQMGAVALAETHPPATAVLPDGPVWVSVPPSALRSGEALPTGTRMFARGMENSDSVTLTFGPDGTRFGARLTVQCRTDKDAADIAARLTRTTTLLREMIEREHQRPNPSDLSGVLTSGAFRSEGRTVRGFWPIERAFVDNLLSGVTP